MLHVVVVGGGPAGLAAATALAQGGIATTLIERAPGRARPCAGLATSRLVEALDLPEHLIAQRVEEAGVQAPSGRSAFVSLVQGDHYAFAIHREPLMALLRQRAEDAGVTMVTGTFLRFTHGEGDYPQLAYRDGEGATQSINAEVVVAADGAASRVAHAIGQPRLPLAVAYQERFSAPAAAAAVAAQAVFGRKVSADQYGYWLPQGDQVLAGVATEVKYGKRVWDGLAELKKRLGGSLEGAKALGREAFIYPLAPRAALTHDRVLFVGDAGGLAIAATHDGLYHAVVSGRLAAETILAHQHLPVPEKLAEYGRAWAAEYAKLFAQQKKVESLFFLSDRRREALIDMAWDREAGRYAAESFLAKKPFAPPFQAAVRIKAKLTTQLIRYNMMNPTRLEGDTMVRQLPAASENYLELALKSRTGPLAPLAQAPAETAPETAPDGPSLRQGAPGPTEP
ncbi:MAG: FAD-dependent monooxygenase [Candidatus Sericytochromatia bacterium]